MLELIELKRAKPPDALAELSSVERPQSPAPSADAELGERERWSQHFVAWFLAATGGDVHPDGGPSGHRWRLEYFECVQNPEAFENYADAYIESYRAMER